MNTDLDTTLTTALHNAAMTTTVSDDALASIMQRAARSTRPQRSRRRLVFTGVTIAAIAAGAGTTYAIVTDRLSPDQAEVVNQMTCDISSENARLVASATGFGRSVDYWTVDGADTHGDLLFDSAGAFGGGGCGPMSRGVAHPQLPWTNYTLTVDPRDGTGLGHFTFMGQAPVGTAYVEIVTSAETIRVDVTSPEGYFVVLAELPVESAPPPAPPSVENVFERIDAYASDGNLLGTGGLS